MRAITIAAASAALVSTSVALKAREYTATYDENEPNSGFYGANLTGSYNGLHYANWHSGPFEYAAGACINVCPQSFPNTAAFDGGKGKQANISAAYANSTVQYFNLKDFYYGCNARLNGTYEGQHLDFNGPANCTLTVTAHTNKNLPATASQTFQYRPAVSQAPNTGFPVAPMAHGVFNAAFQAPGIRHVVFSATGPKKAFLFGAEFAQGPPLPLVDNFHYFTYSSK